MKNPILEEEQIQEDLFASDSTGFLPGQASLYYQTRSGRTYEHWFKVAYVVGGDSQYILAWQAGLGPSNDAVHLYALKRGSAHFGSHKKNRRTWLMLADAGFDAHQFHSLDIIPPIRPGGTLIDPERKARVDLVSAARLDSLFGQRWKTETVNSVIKRKSGDTVRSR